jgi:hypothetical protein
MPDEYRLRQGAIQAKSATELDRPDAVVGRFSRSMAVLMIMRRAKWTLGWSIHALSDNQLRRMESHRSTGQMADRRARGW